MAPEDKPAPDHPGWVPHGDGGDGSDGGGDTPPADGGSTGSTDTNPVAPEPVPAGG